VTGLVPGDHVRARVRPGLWEVPAPVPRATSKPVATFGGNPHVGQAARRHCAPSTPRGQDVSTMVLPRHLRPLTPVVNQASCVKILDDIPLDKAWPWSGCVARDHRLGLVGLRGRTCGPATHVAVIGIGGIGASAVQGAPSGRRRDDLRHRTPIQLKRDPRSDLRGDPHTASSIEEAFRAHPPGDLGSHVRQGHLRHGRRIGRV